MKNLIRFLVMLLFFSCSKQNKNIIMCNDFSFSYYSDSDSYDSKTGKFERKNLDRIPVATVKLTNEELQKIFVTYNEVNFNSLPKEIDCASWNIQPTAFSEIEFTNENSKHKVIFTFDIVNHADRLFCFNGKRFVKLQKMIESILYNKQEIKNLPPKDIFYE